MGKKRSVHLNLPRGMQTRLRHGAINYFYDIGRSEIPLGKDYLSVVHKWATLEVGYSLSQATQTMTFRKVAKACLAGPK
jgi:hypothetical protein